MGMCRCACVVTGKGKYGTLRHIATGFCPGSSHACHGSGVQPSSQLVGKRRPSGPGHGTFIPFTVPIAKRCSSPLQEWLLAYGHVALTRHNQESQLSVQVVKVVLRLTPALLPGWGRLGGLRARCSDCVLGPMTSRA